MLSIGFPVPHTLVNQPRDLEQNATISLSLPYKHLCLPLQ